MSIGVAERLRSARLRKGLTLEELAEKAHIDVQELRELEAGNDLRFLNWPVVVAIRLALILDLHLSSVLGEEVLTYNEWALALASLIEYAANRPGLHMDEQTADLINKVKRLTTNEMI